MNTDVCAMILVEHTHVLDTRIDNVDGTLSLVVDFSQNGGPPDVKGVLEGKPGEKVGIRWADGKLWEKRS